MDKEIKESKWLAPSLDVYVAALNCSLAIALLA
jgi:hypothetical protein